MYRTSIRKEFRDHLPQPLLLCGQDVIGILLEDMTDKMHQSELPEHSATFQRKKVETQ